MNRGEILDEAKRLINTDRAKDYGSPRVNHERIAALWSPILHMQVTPAQVALCMAQVKVSRLCQTPDHLDSFIDGAAYLAIAGELSRPQEIPAADAGLRGATPLRAPE